MLIISVYHPRLDIIFNFLNPTPPLIPVLLAALVRLRMKPRTLGTDSKHCILSLKDILSIQLDAYFESLIQYQFQFRIPKYERIFSLKT